MIVPTLQRPPCFSAACRGRDGNLWAVHLPVETWADAEQLIEQLGLDVPEGQLGRLIDEGYLRDLACTSPRLQ
jgi:hypothetical protein